MQNLMHKKHFFNTTLQLQKALFMLLITFCSCNSDIHKNKLINTDLKKLQSLSNLDYKKRQSLNFLTTTLQDQNILNNAKQEIKNELFTRLRKININYDYKYNERKLIKFFNELDEEKAQELLDRIFTMQNLINTGTHPLFSYKKEGENENDNLSTDQKKDKALNIMKRRICHIFYTYSNNGLSTQTTFAYMMESLDTQDSAYLYVYDTDNSKKIV
ncbi:hypothetical protein F9Y90_05195 (plasmid) [Borrelia miyamotoi]|uniref:Lipoprotein n=1 Tax=Borrelia miyamotoi TaxID=47466 RepID=A0A5P8AXZ0_9SPIR|nr:hypothetical protein [Borrelia miyamotoi]QFP42500.1 hypothetical protein F9Y90_05195 [Borrelia miyamotoi]WAZ72541.1 hypothetical protein O5404_05705 [Borrelia miyamotoi]